MAAVLVLDDASRARLLRRFGPGVTDWCDALPSVVARLARQWGLSVVEPFPGGNTGRTLRCRDRSGRLVVLKLTPERDIAATEAAALRAWAECSRVVDLLDADLDSGAILLAGIEPGTPLTGREFPLPEVAELLSELSSVPAPAGVFPLLAQRVDLIFDLAERRSGGPDSLVSSRKAALGLAADGPQAFLHGDLHPGNVLQGAAGIVAIDPRPCIGDPAFDAVDWVFGSRLGRDETISALRMRFPALDAERVRAWCDALAGLFAR